MTIRAIIRHHRGTETNPTRVAIERKNMARAEDNPCLDGHPNPRPAGAGFRAFGSGPVPLRVCGHLESSGAGETAAQSFLANKPLAPVFSSLAFSPAVDCHPLQIRIDSGKESVKQTGV